MMRNRYRRIVFFFARLLIGFAYWDLLLPRVGLRQLGRRSRSKRLRESAISFRSLAVEMGGVLIKVGQFLSTRVDVLPKDFTDELQDLQDEVPAESFVDIRQVAETAFGVPLEQLFEQFDPEPLAAASLGQVHRARLLESPAGKSVGRTDLHSADVVVKIQRPRIETIIATDLAALRTVGRWLQRYRPIGRRANVPALLDEFTRILYEEIDYLAEGRNAETFAANFSDLPHVRVPQVIWTHTTKKVLTLENVWGIKITDYEGITAAGINRSEVARILLDTYLQQIFEDGFFHADPHPGNLFVNPLGDDVSIEGMETGELGWQLTFVDFGMVGRVPPRMKEGLREMLIGVGTQDASRVVKSYQTLGLLLPTADLRLLEKAEAKLFDRFWGKSMTELQQIDRNEVIEFASEFRELLYNLPFQIPQDIIFLARAVGILSGMCTGLDPDFNVWERLAPYARRLIAEESLPAWEFWLDEARGLLRTVITIPLKMETMLEKVQRGEIAVQAPDVVRQVERLHGSLNRVAIGLVSSACLLGGIQFYLAGYELPGLGLIGLAALGILSLIISSQRD